MTRPCPHGATALPHAQLLHVFAMSIELLLGVHGTFLPNVHIRALTLHSCLRHPDLHP